MYPCRLHVSAPLHRPRTRRRTTCAGDGHGMPHVVTSWEQDRGYTLSAGQFYGYVHHRGLQREKPIWTVDVDCPFGPHES